MGRPETAIIIGDTQNLGEEFLKLALADYRHVWLVDQNTQKFDHWEHYYPMQVKGIKLDLNLEVDELWDQLKQIQKEHFPPLPITLVVQIVALHEPSGDPWESEPDRQFSFPHMAQMTDKMAQEMSLSEGGEILNVISQPFEASWLVQEIFESTREGMLELAQKIQLPHVHIHMLSYTPQSFALQSRELPAHIASDFMPESFAARDIADLGYQVTKVARRQQS